MTRGRFRMLRCEGAGVEAVEAATRHAFPRHSHEQYGIGLIHQGGHRSYSGRGMVEAGSGDIITVNPGEVHDGAPIGDAGRSWRMLYFDPAVIRRAASDISEGRAEACEFDRPVLRDAGLAAAFGHLFTAMTAGEDDAAGIDREALLLGLLAGLMGEAAGGAPRSVPGTIERARRRIDDAPTRPVSLADLARESGLSRFQVLRGFTRATGLTPHAYLVQRRIDLARRLIAGGTALAEAAAASGFADQSHMTRVFVRTYGVSPGGYAGALS
ncbi:AraC family transcriptional regulator [Phreatobacter stygius]|uniref:AraC family transcriptional regulator n=1 Tax=Phreatobacter stygius TaxID=1940610 RepID=A0A4D7B0V2_9HYPH|nr:AraC family transcriptional regulator [Phreatobacter stygius]QCI63076.1 AraC family transcriptional regulator [Phreatobacter stygius]